MRVKLAALIASTVLTLMPLAMSGVSAQDKGHYPDRLIRIIVPYPPGNSTDTNARLLADIVSRSVKQPIIIENRAGADAIIGMTAAANSKPDGYTLAMSTIGGHVFGPLLQKQVAYDPLKRFTPITMVAFSTNYLLVRPEFPAKTIAEFIAYAKENSGKLTFASGNASSRMATELFIRMSGIEITIVPFRGADQALAALLGGHVDAVLNGNQTSAPHLASGALVSLGVSSKRRDPKFPDMPTIAETLEGYEFAAWQGLFAPAPLPPDITQRLNQEFVRALNSPVVRGRLEASGLIVETSTPEELGKVVATDLEKWRTLIREAGIEAQ